MDSSTSKGLENFLGFLRDTVERHNMAEADRAEADAATQDLLHALELGEDKASGRARLGLKLRQVRRQRRQAKDTAEQTKPVVDWVEQNRTVIKGLERLLGDVRKQERRSEGRTYAPRTQVLEELQQDKNRKTCPAPDEGAGAGQ
ncbi:hypothetical protein I310019A7_24370 [Lawsonibacter asaccharolyticus]